MRRFQLRASYGVAALATAGFLGGAGHTILSDTKKPPYLVTENDMKDVLHESHGEDEKMSFDISELAAYGEDGNCQGRVGDYRCWGIFDGHSGWCTSNHLANHMIGYLNDAYDKRKAGSSGIMDWLFSKKGAPAGPNNELSEAEFDKVIHDAFVKLDYDILQTPLKAARSKNLKLAAESLPVAFNGSCAIMAFYHPVSQVLKVALTGDSRAVIGVQDARGIWHANNLTTDQTGDNPSEIQRIRAEHPKDSPHIVRNGRVLGYQPSRTFGDANTKYTSEELTELQNAFWSRQARPMCKTPPYLIASPVVTTVTMDSKRPSFLVIGCDGIYEWLSNDQLVSLVGQWLDKNPVIPSKPYAGVQDHSSGYDSSIEKRPEALGWGPLKPIVKDDNVATHIIRNALGGAEFNKVSMLMSIPAPVSRRFRDDMTCMVVFFNPEPSSKL